jgi:hypothetical protein
MLMNLVTLRHNKNSHRFVFLLSMLLYGFSLWVVYISTMVHLGLMHETNKAHVIGLIGSKAAEWSVISLIGGTSLIAWFLIVRMGYNLRSLHVCLTLLLCANFVFGLAPSFFSIVFFTAFPLKNFQSITTLTWLLTVGHVLLLIAWIFATIRISRRYWR